MWTPQERTLGERAGRLEEASFEDETNNNSNSPRIPLRCVVFKVDNNLGLAFFVALNGDQVTLIIPASSSRRKSLEKCPASLLTFRLFSIASGSMEG